jgi:hypothetical protein
MGRPRGIVRTPVGGQPGGAISMFWKLIFSLIFDENRRNSRIESHREKKKILIVGRRNTKKMMEPAEGPRRPGSVVAPPAPEMRSPCGRLC